MSPADLLESLGTIGDAPEGIERLRSIVLSLAVRGELVTQDSETESAKSLLARILIDKNQFITDNDLKRIRKLEEVAGDEEVHEIQEGWVWCRLGDLANPQAGFSFKSQFFNQSGEGLPLIRIRNVLPGRSDTFCAGEYRNEFIVNDHDYLVGMDGNFNIGLWRGGEALLNQRVTRLRWYSDQCVPRYVVIALQERIDDLQGVKAYTTVQHLSGKQIEACVIPLPPLAEQRRIVARVDELMALLDELEQARDERDAHRVAFRDSALAALQNAEDAEAVEAAWSRIATNLADCITDPADIAPLRQTILQLAVRGRLVPQDPNDEQASEVALGDVVNILNGYAFKSSWYTSKGVRLVRNQNVGHGALNWKEEKRLPLKMFDEYSRFELFTGDIVLSLDRPFISTGLKIARIQPVDLPCLLLQRVACPRPVEGRLDKDYLFMWFRSPEFEKQADPGRSNGVPHISTREVEKMLIRVPSSAEQCRIVAKADELLAICDELEQQLAEAKAHQSAFAAAAVHHLDLAKETQPV